MEDRIWLFSFSGLLIILGVVITVEPEPTLGWYLLSDHDVKLSQEKWIVGPCIFFWGLYGLIKGIRSKPIVKIWFIRKSRTWTEKHHWEGNNTVRIFMLEMMV
ncbi:MAG: hypothetical protein HUN05_05180 [Desulfobacter sp.]|nr:MAG: hypothetical protein HUN05_05180 [Desulfobacter sp.]